MSLDVRAEIITRRSYLRPLNPEETLFETWDGMVARVMGHQRWLWERALRRGLNVFEEAELEELASLMRQRKTVLAGRTMWMGGTPISKKYEATQFNCAFTHIETVYDVVDALWLLLLGAGVGFKPIVGSLNGFARPIPEIEVVRSTRTAKGGREDNLETWDADKKVWTISVGDSSEAWAKSPGKLLAGKYPARKLVLDFTEIRPAGQRMSQFGWISSGDENISKALYNIAMILSRRAGSLLTKIDMMDTMNWLGTSLSSRRSSQICLIDYGSNEWRDFAIAKKDYWLRGNRQREQSNNSLIFWDRPTQAQLDEVFKLMLASGGSEPGMVNGAEAQRRAPWFAGLNPCAEILLPNKGFCNLVENDLGKFRGDTAGLHRALQLSARANYRQTCVDLRDGILQEAWHLSNIFLRLCGVGLTGITRRPDLIDYDYRQMERVTTMAAYGMADELELPRPKNIGTVKPSGTVSKVMGTAEGGHKPMGKYIFNNVLFAVGDVLVDRLRAANYRIIPHPTSPSEVVITLPIAWEDVEFDKFERDGVVTEVDQEPAVSQLERYSMLQKNWTHHNTSVTIYYYPHEVSEITKWLYTHWDDYVGVAFVYRTDPTKRAADLGFPYLPQEVVTQKEYEEYVAALLPVDLLGTESSELIKGTESCAGDVCPVR